MRSYPVLENHFGSVVSENIGTNTKTDKDIHWNQGMLMPIFLVSVRAASRLSKIKKNLTNPKLSQF